MNKYIFPNVRFQDVYLPEKDGNPHRPYLIRMETTIRKKNDNGEWYSNYVYREFMNNETFKTAAEFISFILSRFMADCYLWLLYGEYVPGSKDLYGNEVHKIDGLGDEHDRLKEIYPFIL